MTGYPTSLRFQDDYSPADKQAFLLNTLMSLASVPLSLFFGYSGLVLMPYVLYMVFKPRSIYLLPLIIILAYSSPLRIVFCAGCFLYVMFHITELRRYKLLGAWLFYLCLAPFFIWYFHARLKMPRFVGGVGELTSGFGTYFMMACAFWAAIGIKQLGRTFYSGILYWSLFQIVHMSLLGSGAMDDTAAATRSGNILFCRQSFLSIAIVCGSWLYCLLNKQMRQTKFAFISFVGVFLLGVDFLGLLRYKLTFTGLGLMLATGFFVVMAKKFKRMCLHLNPMVFFAMSIAIVLYSDSLVEKYGGINANAGRYEDLQNTSIEAIFTKLQMKAIDDRASIWNINLSSIRRQMKIDPIWIDVTPVAQGIIYLEDRGYQEVTTVMSPHNTMLYLLRNYGFYGGAGLYLLYLWFFCRKENRRILVNLSGSPVCVILASCLAQGIVGGHTGHYPMILTFGPVLFSLMGACWRNGYEMDRVMKCR